MLHNWEKYFAELRTAIRNGDCEPSVAKCAKHLGINRSTLRDAFSRKGIFSRDEIEAWAARDDLEGNELPVVESHDVESLEDETEGNYRTVRSVSLNIIKSIDDLVRVCKIDLDEWVITNPDVRAWPVAMKLRRALDDGTMVDEPIVIQVHYVGVKLVRRVPERVSPVIAPVSFPDADKIIFPRFSRKRVKRALVLADAHVGFRRRLYTGELVPFHDRKALGIAVEILKTGDFEAIELIGDMLDMSEWSTKFLAEPEFYWTTQPALIELAWWLRKFREAAPGAEIDYFEGNHDMRPEIAIKTHLKAAYQLRSVDELELPHSLSVPRLLALHELKINYVDNYPSGKRWMNDNMLVRHGHVVRSGPGDTAKAVANKYRYTTIFGHVHRREMVTVRMEGREDSIMATGFCPGCMCHIDGRVPGSDSETQWQQGLAVLEYSKEKENIIPISIDNGTAIYGGEIICVDGNDEEIDKMLLEQMSKIE